MRNMKQTVEEAANNYLNRILESTDFEINFEENNYDSGVCDAIFDVTEMAFISGAEWQTNQSPWISVKEKAGCDSSNDCIVMDSDGEVFRACFIRNKWLKYNRRYYVIDNVTHWMPIPSFDEIPEL